MYPVRLQEQTNSTRFDPHLIDSAFLDMHFFLYKTGTPGAHGFSGLSLYLSLTAHTINELMNLSSLQPLLGVLVAAFSQLQMPSNVVVIGGLTRCVYVATPTEPRKINKRHMA